MIGLMLLPLVGVTSGAQAKLMEHESEAPLQLASSLAIAVRCQIRQDQCCGCWWVTNAAAAGG